MKAILVLALVIVSSWSASPVGRVSAADPAGQAPLVPRPFPGSGPSRPAEQPDTPPAAPPPAAPSPENPVPTEAAPNPVPAEAAQALEGVPLYPSAELIDGFDAGSGQRYYLYGTNAPYVTIVAYYKDALRNGGRELYENPPMQQFDLGRFDEDSMAYPPSVVVKDYAWNGSEGYLAVRGTTEKRYRTIIQIVPSANTVR